MECRWRRSSPRGPRRGTSAQAVPHTESGQDEQPREGNGQTEAERVWLVAEYEPMPAGGYERPAHQAVGPEDLGRTTVHGQVPAWVIQIGQDHQAGRMKIGD